MRHLGISNNKKIFLDKAIFEGRDR